MNANRSVCDGSIPAHALAPLGRLGARPRFRRRRGSPSACSARGHASGTSASPSGGVRWPTRSGSSASISHELRQHLRVGPELCERILEGSPRRARLVSEATSMRSESTLALSSSVAESGGRVARSEAPVGVESFVVVDVEQPADGAEQRILVRARRCGWQPGVLDGALTSCGSTRRCPRARARSPRGTHSRLTSPSAASSSLTAPPVARDRLAETAQHDLLGHRLELEVAAGRQEREAELRPGARRRARDPPSSARKRRSKRNSLRWLPTKSRTVQTLAVRLAQPSAELLQEEQRGLSVGRRSSSVSTSGRRRPR